MTTPWIDAKGIHTFYGSSHILHGIDFTVGQGETIGLMGRNGMGKSTLLKSLMGLVRTREGRITFDGRDITQLPPHERVRAGIGYVPQGREIFPLLTVRENLETGYAPLPRKERFMPDEIFSLFPVLESMLGRRGGDLSGGQQQQLAIGRALCTRPKILLLDEPFVGLDPKAAHTLKSFMSELCANGSAIFFSTHVLEVAEKLCNKIAIIKSGKLIAAGDMDKVKGDESLETLFLELTDNA